MLLCRRVTRVTRDPSPGWTDLGPETRHLVLQLPHPVSLRHGGRQVVLGAELLVLKIHQFYGTFKGFFLNSFNPSEEAQ